MKKIEKKNFWLIIAIYLFALLLSRPAQGGQFFACACMWGKDNEMAFTQDTVPNQKSLTKSFDWEGVAYKVFVPDIHAKPAKALITYTEKGRKYEVEAFCFTTIKTF